MNAHMLALFGSLLLSAAPLAASAPRKVTSLSNLSLPAGWIYIPMEAADTFPGAFHDGVSGLVVGSEVVGLRGTVLPWTEGAVRQGGTQELENVRGISWALVRRREAHCETATITAHLRPDIGSDWNLRALVCDTSALDRLKELVRAVAAPNLISVVAPGSAATGALRAADVKKLRTGMMWDEIQQLGVPLAVEAGADGGLVLTFIDARPHHRNGSVRLILSRERALVRWNAGPSE